MYILGFSNLFYIQYITYFNIILFYSFAVMAKQVKTGYILRYKSKWDVVLLMFV